MNKTSLPEVCKFVCRHLCIFLLLTGFALFSFGQNCPVTATTSITTNPDSYYPGLDTSLNAGSKSIVLGAAGFGSTPISSGDLLLIIQMQGAKINSSNSNSYGDGINGAYANGYLSNIGLMAGNMEYIVAVSPVPLSGGTLSLLNGVTNSYKNAVYGTDGQYRYQVIRIGIYYDLVLNGNITAPAWNGSSGGVVVISATHNLNFNGQKITAAGAGFRGGGARQLTGGTGGVSTDVVTPSTKNYNGSKGEGLAGTPRHVNNNGFIFDNGASNEGYPNGSYAAGAPGNAGGGGTDGKPSTNDQNSGGGGGANGGMGGKGGNSWSSNLPSGGEPGAVFQENSPSKMVMGGGGGAGTTNNGTGSLVAGFSSSGAAGGGIVLLTAQSVTGTGTIDVSGQSGFITVLNDGSGGGGAGGSVLLFAGSGLNGITVMANGGDGGTNTGSGSPHGPGGGGGGGVIYSNGPLNTASSVNPGSAGYTSFGTTHYNAVNGTTGTMLQNITKQQTPPQFLYCSLLPVRFTGISASMQQQNIIISWKVSNENAVSTYSIEKSTDGVNFSAAGQVESRVPFNTANSYSFTDYNSNSSGIAYYRIRVIPASGEILFSNTTSIKAANNAGGGSFVSPNPAVNATANIHFTITNTDDNIILLRMGSINGGIVWQKQYRASAGNNVVAIDNPASIPDGIYYVTISGKQVLTTIKMIVQH